MCVFCSLSLVDTSSVMCSGVVGYPTAIVGRDRGTNDWDFRRNSSPVAFVILLGKCEKLWEIGMPPVWPAEISALVAAVTGGKLVSRVGGRRVLEDDVERGGRAKPPSSGSNLSLSGTSPPTCLLCGSCKEPSDCGWYPCWDTSAWTAHSWVRNS